MWLEEFWVLGIAAKIKLVARTSVVFQGYSPGKWFTVCLVALLKLIDHKLSVLWLQDWFLFTVKCRESDSNVQAICICKLVILTVIQVSDLRKHVDILPVSEHIEFKICVEKCDKKQQN